MITIVLDAGHGGHDSGALGHGIVEKNLVLKLSDYMFDKLQVMESTHELIVTTTRSTDEFVSVNERARFANTLKGNVVLVSLHANANTKPFVHGFETYVYGPVDWVRAEGKIEKSKPSFDLAVAMNSAITDLCKSIGMPYRGIYEINIAVLREPIHRAILFEVGYVSNAGDAELMKKDDFVIQMGDGLIDTLLTALNIQPKSPADVDPTSWSNQFIRHMIDEGLMIGFPNGTFAPLRTTTREELAAFGSRLLTKVRQEIKAAMSTSKQ